MRCPKRFLQWGAAILGVALPATVVLAQAQQVVPPAAPAATVGGQPALGLPANPAATPAPITANPENRALERASLGITLSDNSQGKVWIRTVAPGSGADNAGLRPNDQIVKLDDRPVFTYLDVVRYVNMKGASDPIAVHIIRNGNPGMLTASLGAEYARPSSGTTFTEYPGATPQTSGYRGTQTTTSAPAESWRFKWFNGQWWYYTPSNQWLIWADGQWVSAGPTGP